MVQKLERLHHFNIINMESSLKPEFIEKNITNGRVLFDVNFNIIFNGEMYEYEVVTMSYDKWNYSGVVDALVQYKYPIDKMQAVINNYLLDPEDAYAVDEFNKMQAWRKEAKEIAKEALLYELS